MCPKVIATVGLTFDMIGAVLVAIEVVKVYSGEITGGMEALMIDMGKPTPEFKQFEKKKRTWMTVGLVFLLLGFGLQIVSIWMK